MFLPGFDVSIKPGAEHPAEPADVPRRLAELIDVATRAYLVRGHAAPVLLVHTATAPNAVLHTLPVLPERLWADSYAAAWAAAAAITATYAPAAAVSRSGLNSDPAGNDPAAEALHRAADHGDEHVIKFADTAADAFERNHDPGLLAAAHHAAELITR